MGPLASSIFHQNVTGVACTLHAAAISIGQFITVRGPGPKKNRTRDRKTGLGAFKDRNHRLENGEVLALDGVFAGMNPWYRIYLRVHAEPSMIAAPPPECRLGLEALDW
jgi:hypothetical protein